MTPAMVADAARAFRPKVLYPYHYGQTDASKLVDLLAGEEDNHSSERPENHPPVPRCFRSGLENLQRLV